MPRKISPATIMVLAAMLLEACGGLLAQPAAALAREAAQADNKPTSDGTEKAGEAAPMKVTVVSVSGIAHKLQTADPKGQWAPIRHGEVLSELTVIRTGLGAKVVLKFSDRGEVTVKSATKVGIGEFRKKGKLVKTRVGLKYGSMRASVDSAAGPNDFRVTTPVATLSVRGTKGLIAFSGDLGLHLHGTEGTWRVASAARKRNVRAGEWTDGKLTRPTVLAARRRTIKIGDPSGGLTRQEENILRERGGGRGIVGFAAIGSKTGKILTRSVLPRPGIRQAALIRTRLILRSDSSAADSTIRSPDSNLSNTGR